MLAFYLNLISSETDRTFFENIYNSYRKQMFELANSILKNKHDSEDVVHDVFCAVASSHMDTIKNAPDPKDIRNYLLKSVKNASISLIRKRKVRADFEEKKRREKIEFGDEDFLERVCSKLEFEELVSGMELLDEKYREVLYYYFVLDLSVPLMAKLLNRSQNTIRKQITRGKNLLIKVSLKQGDNQDVYD